jgi:serine/threonine-protein kinase
MAAEQLFGVGVTRGVDVYAATIVRWEALTGRRLFQADTEGELVQKVTTAAIEPPSRFRPEITPELDALVMKGVARNPAERWATAADMAEALERVCPPAPRRAVAQWVRESDDGQLANRAALVAAFERGGSNPRIPTLATPFEIPIDVMPTGVSSPTSPSSPSSTSAASVAGVPLDPHPVAPQRSRVGVALLLVLAALALVGGTLGAVALLAKPRIPKAEAAAATAPPPAETAPAPATATASATATPDPTPAPPTANAAAATASASTKPGPQTAVGKPGTPAAKPAAAAPAKTAGGAPKPATTAPVPLYSRE